ncbi:hypothetical protein VD0004_g4977 [Verticillium dahliae]|nr:Protoheme IX farnesyltransferase [Verticillium dahliae VDG1]PNH42297.1 hypothetical protein VD0004_g4977 [Verticillium dahliae]PNH72245.1 hypothetical protein VD0001_g5300 [Verticillium dahliae]
MAVSTRERHDLYALRTPSPPPLDLSALLGQPGREPLSDWYIGQPQPRRVNPAQDAFESAVVILQKELTHDEQELLQLQGKTSMQDVQKAVKDAMDEYEAKIKSSKLRGWLASCSSRILYYGTVFDVFVQHHPEYVSLAWGAMKFLFIAVLNHEELLTEISKAVSKIADVLPRTELHSVLYPTQRMQDSVAMVYAKILEFFVMAVRWYKKGKVMHSLSSITKPFSLSFKPVIEEITERSRRVDELASAASKAEIRDLHIRIHRLDKTLVQVTEMMAVQQQQQVLYNESLLGAQHEYKQLFRKGQVEDIRNYLLLEDTPESEESLAYCRSMRNRRRRTMPTQIPVSALETLESWVSDPSSSLLLAQGQGIRSSSLDFAADFLDAVLDKDYPVLWALPSASEEEPLKPSISGILRSLISQALALDPSIVSEGVNPVNMKHFKMCKGVQQWFALFERCITRLPRLFLVVDMGLIELATSHEDEEHEFFKVDHFVEFLAEMISRRVKGGLKIAVLSWRFAVSTSLDADEVFDQRRIFTDQGRRAERMMRKPKFRAMLKKRNQRFVERFSSSVTISSQ